MFGFNAYQMLGTTPKANKGYLLAVKSHNEISIKNDEKGREVAESMQADGWKIYDQEGNKW